MGPSAHIVASSLAGITVGATLKSVEAGLACALSGIFIDLDHVIDYLRRWKKRRLGISDFFRTDHWGPQGKLFLIFHAWEYLPLLLFLSLIPGFKLISLGLFWGMLLHLIMDHFLNHGHPYTYFLLYRWRRKFDYYSFFSERQHRINQNQSNKISVSAKGTQAR